MKRYNIDTSNGHLVQFDLEGDSWTVQTNEEVVYFTVLRSDPTSGEFGQRITIPVNKKDLEEIRANINIILPKE